MTEDPSDQSCINSDDQLDNLTTSQNHNEHLHDSNVITSPPPLYPESPIRKLSDMSRLKFFPKRKCFKTITNGNSKPLTTSISPPSLLHYSSVNPKLDNYPLNSILTHYSIIRVSIQNLTSTL